MSNANRLLTPEEAFAMMAEIENRPDDFIVVEEKSERGNTKEFFGYSPYSHTGSQL